MLLKLLMHLRSLGYLASLAFSTPARVAVVSLGLTRLLGAASSLWSCPRPLGMVIFGVIRFGLGFTLPRWRSLVLLGAKTPRATHSGKPIPQRVARAFSEAAGRDDAGS